MRVLISGGAGYIGSITTRWLREAGHHPVVLDDLSTGHRAAVDPEVKLVVGSIADVALVRQTVEAEQLEAVVHLAGRTLVSESVANPLAYHRANVADSILLLEGCMAAGVRRFVFSSSAAVYGVPEQVPIAEDAQLAPLSPYGQSKLLFERVLTDVCSAGELGAISLRYFNAAGAWPDGSLGEDHDPETHLIPSLLATNAGGAPLQIQGVDYPTADGTCVRDYVHVCDLAEAHRLALEQLSPGRHAIYNVGAGRGYSVREVTQTARTISGLEIPTLDGPRRAGDPPALTAAATRIQQDLGFAPRYEELAEIIETAWRFRQSHPAGYGQA